MKRNSHSHLGQPFEIIFSLCNNEIFENRSDFGAKGSSNVVEIIWIRISDLIKEKIIYSFYFEKFPPVFFYARYFEIEVKVRKIIQL